MTATTPAGETRVRFPARPPRPHRHLTVHDVMSAPVVSVLPHTPFKRIASLMRSHKISGIPVVSAQGRILGVVSETDLLARERHPSPPRLPFLQGGRRRDLERSGATTAAELMTAPAQTIWPNASLVDAARQLHSKGIRRLVVVDSDQRPIGVLARNDLLRVFLRSDEEIHHEVADLVRRWASDSRDEVAVEVRDGSVVLSGSVCNAEEVELLLELVQSVDGVVDVLGDSLMVVDDDDLGG